MKGRILWVDDQIELLKSHVLFLKSKGYDVTTATNGNDALDLVREKDFHVVLLDEMMPGMDGLETLDKIKEIKNNLPAIMITKNEEESLMEKAMGNKIADYLTKPVNPSQILMAIKKIIDMSRISSEHASKNYMEEFHQISHRLYEDLEIKDWYDIYTKLAKWDLEFDEHPDLGLKETLEDQVRDCNIEFAKYIEMNYKKWLKEDSHLRPILSPDLMKHFVTPRLRKNEKILFIVIDCLRLDQWFTIEPLLAEYFNIELNYYLSILPSATPYSRNAIFSSQYPLELQETFSDIWNHAEDETSMNRYEEQMLKDYFEREDIIMGNGWEYIKVLDSKQGQKVEKKIKTLVEKNFLALVVNFVDILAHRRSESDVIKEIVPDESSYRAIVRNWFRNSWIFSAIKYFREAGFKVVITSDHGSIRVKKPVKVKGDKETSSNIRFKYGRNLNISPKHALVIKDHEEYKLPNHGVNTNYLIAKENFYFVYPTNYHKFEGHFRDTFQHGGLSMEEMILPLITLLPK
ncbi:MAG: response regulator [Candidatus Marinimicrobia bacterium]|nr:response regulator [Candidatus Neomarinimicrobiota bacterium]